MNKSMINKKNEISLPMLFSLLWREKIIIAIITLIVTVLSAIYLYFQPNIYRSQVLLSPSNVEGSGMSAMASQLGGLASIAGINLDSGDNSTQVTMATLESRLFITSFVKKHDLLIPLLAGGGFNRETGEVEIDKEIYNDGVWVLNKINRNPNDWDIYYQFSDILTVANNPKSGLVDISIDFVSPSLAKEWLELFIEDINIWMKEKAIEDAKNNISYLNEKLTEITMVDMQSVFYGLIEEQTKKLMLAEVQEQYAFKIIDPPLESKNIYKPKRKIVLAISFLLGGSLAIFIVLIKYYLVNSYRVYRESDND